MTTRRGDIPFDDPAFRERIRTGSSSPEGKAPPGRPAASRPYIPAADGKPERNYIPGWDGALELFDPIRLQDQPIPPREWLIEGWMPHRAVTGLWGDGGVGKTLIAQQLATSAATGKPWLGLPVRRCRAIAIFCEDEPGELHRRQHDINQAYGLSFGDLEDLRWSSRVGRDNALMEFDYDHGHLTELFEQIRTEARIFGAELIVLDTLADLFPSNENIRPHVRQFLVGLQRLAMDVNGSILLCAHPSLAGMSSGSGLSGSTGWNNGVRSRLYLGREDGDDGRPSDIRVLTNKKANYAKSGDAIRLHWREGVLSPVEQSTGMLASIEKRSAEQVFVELLSQWEADPLGLSDSPKAGNRYAPAVMCKMPAAQSYRVRDFAQAMERLLARREVVRLTVGAPSNRMTRLALSPKTNSQPPP